LKDRFWKEVYQVIKWPPVDDVAKSRQN